MLLTELIQIAQNTTWESIYDCGGGICFGSSFTALGAAFATQGYFMQADMLYYLTQTGLGTWAPLLYIVAALAGMVSLAMGMPPKMYMWFFFGPALYSWLLGTTEAAHGVQWMIAGVPQDQRQVWKLAEVGLKNMNIVRRGLEEGLDLEPSRCKATNDPVYVATLFVWFDSLISDTVQQLVKLLGIYTQRGSDSGGAATESNITNLPGGSGGTGHKEHDRWYLLSNLKWSMLENITSARLHSAELRDLFVTFLSSECGDRFADVIEQGNFLAAANSKTGKLPCTVFRQGNSSEENCAADKVYFNQQYVSQKLLEGVVPVPNSARNLLNKGGVGSFDCFLTGAGVTPPSSGSYFSGGHDAGSCPDDPQSGAARYFTNRDNVDCARLLDLIINGFRWEAGHVYYQIVNNAPPGMNEFQVIYNLFYGWSIRDDSGRLLKSDDEDQASLKNWMIDLILVHLVRNEMAMAPNKVDTRYSSSAQAQKGVETYFANVGTKTKYGEVYTWALMMPYIQGVLLYLLAMGYPFACVLIVVPGWHKSLFTWMAFWAWVKLWDVGFAVVGVLERSIWAMLGNNSSASNISPLIWIMQKWGKVGVWATCSDPAASSDPNGYDPTAGGTADCSDMDYNRNSCDAVPFVQDANGITALKSLQIFDRALLLGANLDFDLANSYYIYIMAALYFAVPAATGQLVLGAKAGAAGMISNIVGGPAGEGGRAAGQTFTAELGRMAAANQATVSQEGYAKAMRAQGIASQAIQAGNMGLDSGLYAATAQQTSQGIDNMKANLQRSQDMLQNHVQATGAGLKAALSPGGWKAVAVLSAVNSGSGLYEGSGLYNAMRQQYDDDNKPVEEQPQPRSAASPGSMAPAVAGAAPIAAGGGVSGAIKWIGGQFQAGMYAAVDAGVALGNNQIARGFNQQFAGMQGQLAEQGIRAFEGHARQSGYGVAERRIGSQAEFGAQMGAWQARRDFAMQAAGYMGAMGMDAGFLNPGNKPTDMTGMAMSGMLGSSVAWAAKYANPGDGYSENVDRRASWLRGNYGQQLITGAYQDGGLGQGWKALSTPLQAVTPVELYKTYQGENTPINQNLGINSFREQAKQVPPAMPVFPAKKD